MNTAYTYRRNFCKNISNEYYGHFKTQGTISFQIFFRKRGTPNNTQKNISHKTLWMKLRFVGLKRCDINKYKNIRTYASGSIKKKKKCKRIRNRRLPSVQVGLKNSNYSTRFLKKFCVKNRVRFQLKWWRSLLENSKSLLKVLKMKTSLMLMSAVSSLKQCLIEV